MQRFIQKHTMALLSLAAFVAVVVLWTLPMLALGQDPTASPTPFESIGDAITDTGEAITAAKAAEWSFVTILAVIVSVLKSFWLAVGRIPPLAKVLKKWGVEINVLIPALIALAYVFIGGGSWMEAVGLIATGPLMGFLHDTGQWIWKLKKNAGDSADMDDGE